MSRTIWYFKAAGLFSLIGMLLTLIAPGAPLAAEEQEPSSDERTVAARVNGQPVYLDQIEPIVQEKLGTYSKFGVRQVPDDLLYQLRLNALEQVIASKALYQEALAARSEGVQEIVEDAMQAAPQTHSEAGLNDEQRRTRIERQASLQDYLKKQGLLDPEIAEAQIRALYEKSKKDFAYPETVKAAHILIEFAETAEPEIVENAREQIEAIREGILSGELSFAEAAQEYSACASAPAGGDLGSIPRGFMPAEFDAVAFQIEPGELSEPLRTRHGWHLLRVEQKQPAGTTPFDQMKEFFGKHLKQQRSKELIADHMRMLREKADVEILLENPTEENTH